MWRNTSRVASSKKIPSDMATFYSSVHGNAYSSV